MPLLCTGRHRCRAGSKPDAAWVFLHYPRPNGRRIRLVPHPQQCASVACDCEFSDLRDCSACEAHSHMNLLTKCSGALARCFGAVSFLRRFAEITAQHPAGIFDAALCLNPADLTLPQLLASQPTLRRVVGYHILPNVPVLDAFWTTPFMLPNTVLSTLLVTMPSFSLSRSLPFSACSHAAATSIQSIARKLFKPAGRQKTQLPCRQNTTLKHSGSCRFCRVRLRQSRWAQDSPSTMQPAQPHLTSAAAR